MERPPLERASAGIEAFWFPGRWLGGVSLVLAPALLLVAALLRLPFDFFFPAQLVAASTHPTLLTTAYAMFYTGIVCLWPAILTLTRAIGRTHPSWAFWGGTLTMLGLFKRAFDAGANHFALALVDIHGVDAATRTVGDYYGAFEGVARTLGVAALTGWIVLAIGAYKAGVLGLGRAVLLALMAGLMMGVLKGSTWFSILQVAGLCVALVPFGITVLRDGPARVRAPLWQRSPSSVP
ncbi:MAG: hypothetical protein ACRD2X_22790 [Vicinamibacteraceae bacterium]